MLAHVGRFRGLEPYKMSAGDYKTVQSEFAEWIDARVKSGVNVDRMNEELKAAGLILPDSIGDDFLNSHAGFFDKISEKPVRGASDLRAIAFGIQTGSNCNADVTLLLYADSPLRYIARMNAEETYVHGYQLVGVSVGPGTNRLIGSQWTPSRCASNWSGDIFRIDLLPVAGSVTNILNEEFYVFGGDAGDIKVERDAVTFHYDTDIRNVGLLVRHGVWHFRIEDGRAIREAPIATSYGGFLDEWLKMDDAEAARWSSPQAAGRHNELAERFKTQFFDWVAASDCGDFPPIHEIEIQSDQTDETAVFVIGGSTIESMKMLAISDHLTPTCRGLDIDAEPSPITNAPKQ